MHISDAIFTFGNGGSLPFYAFAEMFKDHEIDIDNFDGQITITLHVNGFGLEVCGDFKLVPGTKPGATIVMGNVEELNSSDGGTQYDNDDVVAHWQGVKAVQTILDAYHIPYELEDDSDSPDIDSSDDEDFDESRSITTQKPVNNKKLAMTNYKSKFDQLHESAFNRYTQGAGFLAGDVVKFKKKTPKSEWFQKLANSVQDLVLAMMKSENNLRVGFLHKEFPHAIGAHGANELGPAQLADIYMEISPANWAYPMTVPLDQLERIVDETNRPRIPDHLKDKNRVEKTGKKGKADTQTKIDDSNRQNPTQNIKLPGGKKWDDSKVGGGNAQNLPGTGLRESVEYDTNSFVESCVEALQESVVPAPIAEAPNSFNSCEYIDGPEGKVIVRFEDTVHSQTHGDEIPVTVEAAYRHHEQDMPNWTLVDIKATDDHNRPVPLHDNDTQYLTDRADDFIGRYKDWAADQKEGMMHVDEALGNPNTVQVGGHTITHTREVTRGEDPTEINTWKFDNGYSIVEFFGDYELKDPAGKRIKYEHKPGSLDRTLNHLGLPRWEVIEAAFDQIEQQRQAAYDPEADAANRAMGDMSP